MCTYCSPQLDVWRARALFQPHPVYSPDVKWEDPRQLKRVVVPLPHPSTCHVGIYDIMRLLGPFNGHVLDRIFGHTRPERICPDIHRKVFSAY